MVDEMEDWIIVNDKEDYPFNGNIIMFVGNAGKLGIGFYNEHHEEIETGYGIEKNYKMKNVYAYKYTDVPQIIIDDTIKKNKKANKKSLFEEFGYFKS